MGEVKGEVRYDDVFFFQFFVGFLLERDFHIYSTMGARHRVAEARLLGGLTRRGRMKKRESKRGQHRYPSHHDTYLHVSL